jgi:transposase
VRVTFEATGKYSVDLAFTLHAVEGLEIAVVNPKTAHDFIRGRQRSKSDKCDARTLADWAKEDRFRVWTPASPKAYEVRDRVRHQWALKCLRTDLKNQLHAALSSSQTSACVIESLTRSLQYFEQELTVQMEEVKAAVLNDPEWARKYNLMLTVPGIASTSALAALGELVTLPNDLSSRTLVAYSGLDPQNSDSGDQHKQARISRRGSPHLRRSLFWPAMTAIRIDPHFRQFFQELKYRGKRPRVAVIAVERKMIHALHGMFQSNTAFNGEKLFPKYTGMFSNIDETNSK